MRIWHWLKMGVVLACLLTWTGCKEEVKPRVGLIMKARTNPFFSRMEAGAREAAQELGVELQVWDLERETDTDKQAAHVEAAISQGMKVILIAPADSKAIVAPLLQARKQGVRIINIDNRIDADEAKRAGLEIAAFIGPDNVEGARKSTQAMIEAMGGQGQVVMLEGIRGVDNAEARKRGFQKAVEAAAGKVEVMAMDTALWDRDKALEKMEGFLNNYPNLDGVFAANDQMALGALAAIRAAGKAGRIVIAAYDNLEEIHAPIRAGNVHATIEQHPDRMGYMGVEQAVKLINGEEIPDEINVDTDLVTKETLSSE